MGMLQIRRNKPECRLGETEGLRDTEVSVSLDLFTKLACWVWLQCFCFLNTTLLNEDLIV